MKIVMTFLNHSLFIEDYLQVDRKMPRPLGGCDMDDLTLLCDPYNRLESNKIPLSKLRQIRVSETCMNAEWWNAEGRRR